MMVWTAAEFLTLALGLLVIAAAGRFLHGLRG
jgi:hypothetical protein